MSPRHLTTLLGLLPVLMPAAELAVGPDQPHTSLHGALAAALPGDTITVHGGTYSEGTLLIDKPVSLIGLGRPHIDGGGAADVIIVTASDVTISGFHIEHGGISALSDVAGIKVAGAQRVVISQNRVSDCSFGIHLSNTKSASIRGNDITGSTGLEENSGNGIHAWSCSMIDITGNRVTGHRDGIYLEFTPDSTISGNTIEGNLRYGLHFMFAHRNSYRENTFLRNGAGVAVMYSHQVRMEANRFAESWGNASYGLLLKDIDDSVIIGNTFERNSTGATIENSSRTKFEDNRFFANGWALHVSSSCNGNTFVRNNFSGNSFDLTTNGELELNRFDHNYWDKAETYDLDRNGISDVPYRPVSLFAMLIARMPSSLLLLRSPLVHFLDRAERIFPSLTPDGLVDANPAMRPHKL